jgi:SAM-dependent methyltransferase
VADVKPTKTKRSKYEDMYSSGAGWKYDFKVERSRIRLITNAIGLRRGDAALEIGCGEGFHSHVLYELGFRVIGNERTTAGIEAARKNHPLVHYIQADTLDLMKTLPKDHFDMILARGHSWWHYKLVNDVARGVDVPAYTARLFEHIKPGGHFVLCIRTDFTGTHPDGSVSNNRWQDYVDLFSPLGEIVYISDWAGTPLPDDAAARRSGKNIVIATRKPGGAPPTLRERFRRELARRTHDTLDRRIVSKYEERRFKRAKK